MILNHIIVISHQRELVETSWDTEYVVFCIEILFESVDVIVSTYLSRLVSCWVFKLWLTNVKLSYLDSICISGHNNPCSEERVKLLYI